MSKALNKSGMRPIHPGDFVRTEVLNELGLSVARAADILNIRRATLSNFLNERSALSPEMALRLEKAFGVSMETLLSMQCRYDSHTIRQRESHIAVKRYSPA